MDNAPPNNSNIYSIEWMMAHMSYITKGCSVRKELDVPNVGFCPKSALAFSQKRLSAFSLFSSH